MDGSSVSRRSLLWACATAAVLIPGTAENAGTGAVPAPGEDLAEGTLIQVPELNRAMTYDSRIGDSAVVIGDSQTGPETWVARGLDALGYRTVLRGAGGTGYIRGTQRVGSYHQALTRQQWLLPWGHPRLVILQGGGNDVDRATDAELARAVEQMIGEMRRTYPQTQLVMVGVISSGPGAGLGGRRFAADQLVAGVAAEQEVPFLSVGDWWTRLGLEQFLQPDGIHFTPEGHREAGRVFARELGSMLASGTAG